MRTPNFNNILKILDKKKADRPTLYEFAINDDLHAKWADKEAFQNNEDLDERTKANKIVVSGFKNLGYDYANVVINDFTFRHKAYAEKETLSLNDNEGVCDRESFRQFKFNNPDDYGYSGLDVLGNFLPEGMKLIIAGPGGVLENVIAIVGYENLCMMIYDDEGLVAELFDEVGARMYRYYEACVKHPSVGVIIHCDDWGFNTQTMVSPELLRKYVFPWHKKIVDMAHSNNKPAILHSCGYPFEIMDDIIDDMHYDAKHSFEDNIVAVEKAYELWGDRIAILGGIDLDFLCTKSLNEIRKRAENLIAITDNKGYALGSGNSIPPYVPDENFHAMREVALK